MGCANAHSRNHCRQMRPIKQLAPAAKLRRLSLELPQSRSFFKESLGAGIHLASSCHLKTATCGRVKDVKMSSFKAERQLAAEAPAFFCGDAHGQLATAQEAYG